jgi:hypothetical protein
VATGEQLIFEATTVIYIVLVVVVAISAGAIIAYVLHSDSMADTFDDRDSGV